MRNINYNELYGSRGTVFFVCVSWLEENCCSLTYLIFGRPRVNMEEGVLVRWEGGRNNTTTTTTATATATTTTTTTHTMLAGVTRYSTRVKQGLFVRYPCKPKSCISSWIEDKRVKYSRDLLQCDNLYCCHY